MSTVHARPRDRARDHDSSLSRAARVHPPRPIDSSSERSKDPRPLDSSLSRAPRLSIPSARANARSVVLDLSRAVVVAVSRAVVVGVVDDRPTDRWVLLSVCTTGHVGFCIVWFVLK